MCDVFFCHINLIVEYHKSVDDFFVVINLFDEFACITSYSLGFLRFFYYLTNTSTILAGVSAIMMFSYSEY